VLNVSEGGERGLDRRGNLGWFRFLHGQEWVGFAMKSFGVLLSVRLDQVRLLVAGAVRFVGSEAEAPGLPGRLRWPLLGGVKLGWVLLLLLQRGLCELI